MLRIRTDKEATIRQLKFPQDIVDQLQKMDFAKVTEEVKKHTIRKLTGVSPCCVCGGIPSCEIIYRQEGAIILERYCEKCIKSVYAREQVL